jgi:hypothetical protein
MTATVTPLRACAHCGRHVGMLPNGRALPYTVEDDGAGRRVYRCSDIGPCHRAHFARHDQLGVSATTNGAGIATRPEQLHPTTTNPTTQEA